jgi:hypothetical protein
MNLTNKIRQDLTNCIYNYYREKLEGGVGEVSMLKSIHENIKDLGKEMNTIIQNNSLGFNLTISSNFVHQTPRVSYMNLTSKNYIEFGDILYIYSEKDNANRKRETALLMQAKVFEDKKVDSDQLTLYETWPDFWYHPLQKYPKVFHLNLLSSPHDGGRYLLLDDSLNNQRFGATMTPEKNLKANQFDNYIENELVGLLEFSRGKMLLKDDWEKAIKELHRRILINKKFFSGVPRSQEFMYSLLSQTNSSPMDFFDNDKNDDFKENSKGFWLVHIIAESREL